MTSATNPLNVTENPIWNAEPAQKRHRDEGSGEIREMASALDSLTRMVVAEVENEEQA
jgi:hypothetical protein